MISKKPYDREKAHDGVRMWMLIGGTGITVILLFSKKAIDSLPHYMVHCISEERVMDSTS